MQPSAFRRILQVAWKIAGAKTDILPMAILDKWRTARNGESAIPIRNGGAERACGRRVVPIDAETTLSVVQRPFF
jgi:hypothetical protein